jgi:hypothetical protein
MVVQTVIIRVDGRTGAASSISWTDRPDALLRSLTLSVRIKNPWGTRVGYLGLPDDKERIRQKSQF